ncbi:uncharacterized protein LOC118498393 [Phyllostomus discolor]|uniref:Uncharacterized protein LOC118498393 n=1 Tax=Phyllostomus discolor TaxID=89673 RepID=A0A7E6CYW6_9CHIR|nr:uncharacterized protein LOC118498393 [Phyllostomus discolor]
MAMEITFSDTSSEFTQYHSHNMLWTTSEPVRFIKNPQICMELQETSDAKVTLRNKDRVGGITCPDFKPYDKAIVIKTEPQVQVGWNWDNHNQNIPRGSHTPRRARIPRLWGAREPTPRAPIPASSQSILNSCHRSSLLPSPLPPPPPTTAARAATAAVSPIPFRSPSSPSSSSFSQPRSLWLGVEGQNLQQQDPLVLATKRLEQMRCDGVKR